MTSDRQPTYLPLNDPPRRPIPPTANLVNAPGIVLSPHTPENPRVYPRSPHPSATRTRIYSPIPGPQFEVIREDQDAPEDSPEDVTIPARQFAPTASHSGTAGPSQQAGGTSETSETHDGDRDRSPERPESPPGPSGPPGGGGGGPPGPPGGGGGGGPPGPPGPPAAPPAATPESGDELLMRALRTFTAAVDRYNSSATAPRSTRSSLKNPDVFDGSDPSKLASFLNQCYLIFADRPQDYSQDDDKILFIISYLRGTAQKWFEPNLYDPTPGAVPLWDGNFPLFIRELSIHFGPHDPVGDAEDNLRQCRMKSSDKISTYLLAFDTYAAITGWGDRALRHQFYEGLPSRIKDEMVHQNYVNDLAGVKTIAHRIDARYWHREAEKARERARNPSGAGHSSGNTRTGQSNPPASGTPRNDRANSGKKKKSSSNNNPAAKDDSAKKAKPYAEKLGKDGKLKPEERERRLKAGLCMFCGGSGHTADECKKKKAISSSTPGTAQGKAATTSTADDSAKTSESKK